MIYALLLYKKKVNIYRTFAAEGAKTVLIGLFLNTWWLSILYKNHFFAVFMTRLPKELMMFPIHSILLFLLLKALSEVPLYVE